MRYRLCNIHGFGGSHLWRFFSVKYIFSLSIFQMYTRLQISYIQYHSCLHSELATDAKTDRKMLSPSNIKIKSRNNNILTLTQMTLIERHLPKEIFIHEYITNDRTNSKTHKLTSTHTHIHWRAKSYQ